MTIEKRLLALILGSFVLLGWVYSGLTPVFEASDELWHYPMIQHLASGHSLPVQVFDPAAAGPWKQEASQPPLYYYVGAVLTFWIDTSDMDQVRRLNPHVDNGVITEDGNTNLVVHDPALNPWTGTLLAVRVVRFFSVFLGAATVYLTYLLALEVIPDRPWLALGAAAFNAFTPMFLFISGAVNNDNLVIPLASLTLLLLIRLVKFSHREPADEAKRLLVLGIVIGLGALTKITAAGLLPLALGGIFLARWKEMKAPLNGRRLSRLCWETAGRMALVLIPVLLIAGWWYLRNIRLYGDWSGWNAFVAVLGQRAHPASLAQLWDERWGFMLSYWGLFGGVNVPMPTWIYHIFNGMAVIATIGFPIFLGRQLSEKRPITSGPAGSRPAWFRIAAVFDFCASHSALILCLLWTAAVIIGLIRWATVTWSSQGRLVFSAISSLNVVFSVGLAAWLPGRIGRGVLSACAAFFFAIAALAPILWLRPAYEVPKASPAEDIRVVNQEFGGVMRLVGYEFEAQSVQPGESIDLFLVWEAVSTMNRDWSVFVHLNDPVLEIPIAQRDMYPGQGLLATSLMSPGQRVTDRYHLRLPETAVAPAALQLVVGLYDVSTCDVGCERLAVDDAGMDSLVLDRLALRARVGDTPNPVSVNFEGELELQGFEVSPRRLQAGEAIALDLFWRPRRDLDLDYTFFAQVVDKETTRWASQDLAQTTSDWTGVTELSMNLALSEDTPGGIYPVIVGAYTRNADGGFDRLQIVTSDGRLTDDFLSLTFVRVD